MYTSVISTAELSCNWLNTFRFWISLSEVCFWKHRDCTLENKYKQVTYDQKFPIDVLKIRILFGNAKTFWTGPKTNFPTEFHI